MTTMTEKFDMNVLRRFYGAKYDSHGVRAEAVGWQSAEKQRQRFDVLCGVGDLQGRSVLDVGCGFGDLLGNLKGKGVAVKYHGVDVMESFVEVARVRGQSPSTRWSGLRARGEDRERGCSVQ